MSTQDRARELAERWYVRTPTIPELAKVVYEIAALLDLLVKARKWLDRLDGMRDRPRYTDELEIVPLIEKIDKVVKP